VSRAPSGRLGEWHNSVGIGVAIAVLGAIPVVVGGIALLLSAGVQRRDRQNKPWA
jgi:hypothetical protein